jgi:hypothetical protein
MPWVKGQTGNPNGRPKKGQAVTDLAEALLLSKSELGIPRIEEILLNLYNLAKDPNAANCIPAARLLLAYVQPEPKAAAPDDSVTSKDPMVVTGVVFVPAVKDA